MDIKPKVQLDESVLELINEFYSVRLGKKHLFVGCFSNPNLNSHLCCSQAPLDEITSPEGSTKCSYCNHIPGRVCKITCHINHFCLAAFAYRLGIGGNDFKKAVKHNTRKLSYKKLYEAVITKLNNPEEHQEEDAQDLNVMELESHQEIMEEEKKKMTQVTNTATPKKDSTPKVKAPILDDNNNELVTIGQAAKIYGCTYVCMRGHVKRGNLNSTKIDEVNYIKKEDVVKFSESRKAEKATQEAAKAASKTA